MAKTKKKNGRPYSMRYTAAGTPRRYLLSGIPAKLWITVQARAKREGIAVRQVVLQLAELWVTRPEGAVIGVVPPPAEPRRKAPAAKPLDPPAPVSLPFD